MARPIKLGLDYFPLDTTIDDNLELLEAECGLVGFAIIIKLWQKIYANGYYIEWSEDNILLFARKLNMEVTAVNSVINVGFKRNLFDKTLHKQYKILTSSGIQKRYFKICTDAKRKNTSIIKEYNLLTTELTKFNLELTSLTPEESTQSKVNKNRVEKNKDKDKGLPKPMGKQEEVEVEVTEKEKVKGNRKEIERKEKVNNIIAEDIITHLNQKTNKNYKSAIKKTKNLIQTRLNEGFTVDDFKKVIDIKCRDWLHDNKMNKFLRPETLFSNKFEGYLNQQNASSKSMDDLKQEFDDEWGNFIRKVEENESQ